MLKKLYILATVIFSITVLFAAHIFAQSLERIGSYDSLIAATDVVVSGHYAYVVDGIRGLVILDISNPASPAFVGSYNGPWSEMSLAVSGGHAYIGSGSTEPYAGTFSVVDISNPANPFLTDSLSFNWEVTAVEIGFEDAFAYIATYGGNYVISTSNPYDIQAMNTFDTPGYPLDFQNYGLLYVADGQAGLTTLSLNHSDSPQFLGNCDTPGNALAVGRSDRTYPYTYVADNDSGLAIINIEDPSNPVLANAVHISGHTKKVKISNYDAFVINDSVLEALECTNPVAPEIVSSATISPLPRGLDARGDFPYFQSYIYLACSNSLQIYLFNSSECHYIPGDINGNGSVNGVDIVYAVGFLKGYGPPPRFDCHPVCLLTVNPFYAAGDMNGNCVFNGVDITYFVRYLKLQVPNLLTCPDCPPAGFRIGHQL
jgi:hypothetical protein